MVRLAFALLAAGLSTSDATASTCVAKFNAGAGTDVPATPLFYCGAGTSITSSATGCAAAACVNTAGATGAADNAACCNGYCDRQTTWKSGAVPAGTTEVTAVWATGGSPAALGSLYCGANKVPITALSTTALASNDYPATGDASTCCNDVCSAQSIVYATGAGTDTTTAKYCGTTADSYKMPIAAQSTTASGTATNSGSDANKLACCNAQCAAANWMTGAGTDAAAVGTTKAKLYCGKNRMPVASQSAKDSTVDAIAQATAVNNACCDDICSKVTFSAGKGTDVTTTGSETYFCGEGKVPAADQGTKLSGSDAVGSSDKDACCDDACGKATFKAGKGTDVASSKTIYCGENKVPVAKQSTVPSGSDSIGAGEKGTCCAAACSTMKYMAGEGTDADTTYFCGKEKAPKMDQKMLPCDAGTCTAAGKSHCCAATCSSTKWHMGKKPTSPASGAMYCGDGMSPKTALSDTVCAGDTCSESTDAATCCMKTMANNSSATTDARTAGVSVLVLSAAVLLAIQ